MPVDLDANAAIAAVEVAAALTGSMDVSWPTSFGDVDTVVVLPPDQSMVLNAVRGDVEPESPPFDLTESTFDTAAVGDLLSLLEEEGADAEADVSTLSTWLMLPVAFVDEEDERLLPDADDGSLRGTSLSIAIEVTLRRTSLIELNRFFTSVGPSVLSLMLRRASSAPNTFNGSVSLMRSLGMNKSTLFTPSDSQALRKTSMFSAALKGLLIDLNLGIVPGLMAFTNLHSTIPSFKHSTTLDIPGEGSGSPSLPSIHPAKSSATASNTLDLAVLRAMV